MSALADHVELEAAIAEAELSDAQAEQVKAIVGEGRSIAEALEEVKTAEAEAELAPTPTPELEPEPGEPTDKQLRELDHEGHRHEEKVRAIMGGFVAGFETCETCSGYGIVPPGPRPQEHEHFKACETCAGFGEVKTGSLRAGNEARDCPACMGRGYLEALDEQGAPLSGPNAAPPPVAPVPSAPAALELAPAPSGGASEPRFGVPAWMGDQSIGQG